MPLDQVAHGTTEAPVIDDGFYYIFRFSFYHFRGRSKEVCAMDLVFDKRGKKSLIEDIVDASPIG